jgi:hypothetical protein
MTERGCAECGARPPRTCGCAWRPDDATRNGSHSGSDGTGDGDTRGADDTFTYSYDLAGGAPATDRLSGRTERRRGPVLLAAVAAVAVMLGVGALAGGLFGGFDENDDERNRSAPGLESMEPFLSAGPDVTVSARPSKKPRTSPSVSRSASPEASTSPSPSTPPSPSATATPSASPTTSTPAPPPGGDQDIAASGPTLRLGDSGEEVVELQERLRQAGLYDGAPHGRFDDYVARGVFTYQQARAITADQAGVYGPTTRAGLESETTEPYDDGWGQGHGYGRHD